MTAFMETVQKRRSIRNYQDKDIPQELLDYIFEAVRWAPSWANTQCWEIIAVRDAEAKQRLQEIVGKGNPATRAMIEAPVLLAVCGKLQKAGYYKSQAMTKFEDWFMFDLGLATQNLCLAAHHMGLGTVIIGLFDHDGAKEILEVPDGYEVVALVPLGYPARGTSAPKRRETSEFVHYDKF